MNFNLRNTSWSGTSPLNEPPIDYYPLCYSLYLQKPESKHHFDCLHMWKMFADSFVGIVVLRSMIFVITPPAVSIPNDEERHREVRYHPA